MTEGSKVTTLTYFALKAAIFPAVCVMEVGGVEYQGKPVTLGPFSNDLCVAETWADMKPKVPNGQLPVMTLEDGSVVPESGAIMRACAAQAGLLGTGKDFIISEMLIGMVADLVKTTFGSGKIPTAFTVEKFKEAGNVKEFNEVTKPAALAQIGKFDKWLLPAGDRFTGSGQTLGEIELWCKLYMISNGSIPEVAGGKLEPFFKRMSALPGIKKVLAGESKLGLLHDYLVPMP